MDKQTVFVLEYGGVGEYGEVLGVFETVDAAKRDAPEIIKGARYCPNRDLVWEQDRYDDGEWSADLGGYDYLSIRPYEIRR
ncbi:MAG TPA: hypothetical protein VFK80_02845 [Limnochordia bacterium]|nr:hypothetical protein [Limnochordia bacterium]